jgi:hypothetical protein
VSNLANPYEPPAGDESDEPESAVVRGHVAGGALHLVNGDTLVAEKGSTLPPLCLWNGEPCTAGRRTTNFAWAPGWVWIFVVSPLLLLVVYLLARKRGELSYCLGTTAQGRQRQVRWLLGGAVLLGLPLVAIGVSLRLHLLVACASLASFVAVLAAVVQSPTLRVVRIDERNVHIKLEPGAAAAFARAMAGGK